MKLIVVEFKVDKAHDIQNTTGSVVSMTLMRVKLLFCANDWQACYSNNRKQLAGMEQNGTAMLGGGQASTLTCHPS